MHPIAAFADVFPVFWLTALSLLGAIIGSFLNVVIYRMPVMLERRWQREAQQQLGVTITESPPRFDLMLPHSSCPHCQTPLAIRDNIPLVSWLWLNGKARCCAKSISCRYPLIELTTALLFAGAGALLPVGLALLGVLLFMAILLTLAVIDLKTLLLPDVLTLPLLWLGLLFNVSGSFVSLEQAIMGAAIGYLSLWGLFWLFKYATGKEALGYGDFKLLAALGAWMGWQTLPNLVLIAALCGLVFTLLQRGLSRQNVDQPLAFGPWLALAGAINMVFFVLPTSY